MKIKAIELMRSIRDKVDTEIKGLSWKEESEFLQQHIKSFDFITKKTPNNSIQSDKPVLSDFSATLQNH